MAIDLVCGMTVDEKTAKWVAQYKGQKYYFCNKHDKEAFEKEPEKYLAKSK
jgi:YHS domain-containing protein